MCEMNVRQFNNAVTSEFIENYFMGQVIYGSIWGSIGAHCPLVEWSSNYTNKAKCTDTEKGFKLIY